MDILKYLGVFWYLWVKETNAKNVRVSFSFLFLLSSSHFRSVIFQMTVLFYSALKQQVSENSVFQLYACFCLTREEPKFYFFALRNYLLMLLYVLSYK